MCLVKMQVVSKCYVEQQRDVNTHSGTALENNDVARTLKMLRTSKGDYWNKQ